MEGRGGSVVNTDLETADPTIQNVGSQLVAKATNPKLDVFARMGTWLAAAEAGANDKNGMAMSAALRMAYADSLGLPLHAASEVYLIKGTFTLSSKLCRAQAIRHGLRVTRVDETEDSCTAAVIEIATGKELGRTTYTYAEAQKAGLTGTNWQKNRGRMMWARASKRVLDDFAPHVTVGVMTYEEAIDAFPDAPLPFDSDEVLTGEVVE